MAIYDIQLIFEPTGDWIDITGYESNADNEQDLHEEILHYTSVTTWKKDIE